MIQTTLASVVIVCASWLIAAEGIRAQQQTAPAPSGFRMMTSAYSDEDWIPIQYTCGVADASSPEVQWADAPQAAASFALILHDPDTAPAKGAMDVTHWIVWNIPASATQLAAGIEADASPDGIRQGQNVRGVNGYQPPCPPVGVRPHHYIFELYALDTQVDLPAGSTRVDLFKAIDGHVIGKASLVGVFGQGIDDQSWRWGAAKLPDQ